MPAGNPVTADPSQLVSLTDGSSIKNVAFTGLTLRRCRGKPLVVVGPPCLLGGLSFTATLVTTKTTAGAALSPRYPVVLQGSSVTDASGFTGVVPPGFGPVDVVMA